MAIVTNRTSSFRRRWRNAAMALLLVGFAGGMAASGARADEGDWHGHGWRHHGWHGHERHHYRYARPGYYPGYYYVRPPVVYAPPPAVYAPPPVVYAPPPVVYAPPTSIDLVFPLHFH